MHKWGFRTNGPQGIWGNRGSGSQHVLVCGTNGPYDGWDERVVSSSGAYGLYGIQHIWSTMHIYYAILFHK